MSTDEPQYCIYMFHICVSKVYGVGGQLSRTPEREIITFPLLILLNFSFIYVGVESDFLIFLDLLGFCYVSGLFFTFLVGENIGLL